VKSSVRSAVGSAALGATEPPRRVAGDDGGGGGPAERVENGSFSSADGWDTSGLSWSIGAGLATNATPGQFLSRPIQPPLVGGEAFTFSLDVVANPTLMQVILFDSVAEGTQNLFNGMASIGANGSSGTVSGAFDTIRIRSAEDPSMVIDNVSFIA
jgi:hypothetical protein